MKKKTVIVCCASSMITSTMAVAKVREVAVSIGAPEPRIIQCKFSEVQGNLTSNQVDFIVPTGKLKGVETGDIPVIKGTAFVTGVGEENAKAEIAELLKAE